MGGETVNLISGNKIKMERERKVRSFPEKVYTVHFQPVYRW